MTVAFAYANDYFMEKAKLQIYVRNHTQEYGDQWWADVLSHFRYLMAKHPENEKVQNILGDMLIRFDGLPSYDFWYEWETTEQIDIQDPEEIPPQVIMTWLPLWERLVNEWVFDEDLIEKTWIWWVNNEIRIPRWLDPIVSEYRLRETARDRSLSLRAKWVADHKRFWYSGYYDYADITKRFETRGVVFENHSGATSTENIGRARHTCEGDWCTDAVIKDIRRIYEYFASEESYNWVHWRTMIHPRFRVVGVSFAVDLENDKVFGVMHYGTKLK